MAIRRTTSPRRRAWAILASLALVAGFVSLPAGADETVVSLDFSSGSHEPLVHSGSPTLSVIEFEGDQVLSVEGRDADYVGVETPEGLLVPGATYTFSTDLRLADGVPDLQARLVGVPGYSWIGNTTVTSDEWTTISGEWTVPADADPTARVYIGTEDQTSGEAYDYYVDNFEVTRQAADDDDDGDPGQGDPGTPGILTNDFEESLEPWQVRGSGDASADLTDTEAYEGSQAAIVTGRTNAWNGLAAPVADVLTAGSVYDLTAAVKLPEGTEGTADIRISVERDVPDGTADKWVTLATYEGIGAGEWFEIELTFTTPAEPNLLYFETVSGTADFLVDAIVVSGITGEVQDLLPIQDSVSFPVGVAIDERETSGPAAELTLRHFNQITAENHMKPEYWYDAERNFRPHPQAITLMDFAVANDLAVYGHTLVWHSQVSQWFFEDDNGEPLTSEDSEILRERMRAHIFDIAEQLSDDYGLFGSETNPLVAWDVVNEVVADDAQPDGLRRSEWYRIMGADYVDLAFRYADEAFNDVYAAPGSDRPVALFINDYNTEQGGKQDRYFQVIDGLLDRGVPVDGVGHQFHVNLATPISALDATLERFAALPVTQAVTELDVTIGTSATTALLIEQGHFYRDAFNVFRDHEDELFSVTIWGLTDGRSWRAAQYPLAFTDSYQAKEAYYGIVDSDELTPIIKRGVVFQGEAPLTEDSLDDAIWRDLPLREVGTVGGFQLRWNDDGLLAYVEVSEGFDDLQFHIDDQVIGLDEVDGVSVSSGGGTQVLALIPLDLDELQAIKFDLTITQGETVTEWNPGASLGDLVLVESLSVVEAREADGAPVVDGVLDDVYGDAVISTDTVIEGDGSTATGEVRTVWHGDSLHVFVEVTDPEIDLSASNPWEQDSVELFVDLGNAKNGSYRPEDMQIRINVENELSFGTGDEALQRGRVVSATARTDTGYVVEAVIDLEGLGGAGSVHGFDVQVNDGAAGSRIGVKIWGDPTGLSYQSTERWGVVRMIAGEEPVDPDPSPSPSPDPSPSPSPDPSSSPEPSPDPSKKPVKPGLPKTGH